MALDRPAIELTKWLLGSTFCQQQYAKQERGNKGSAQKQNTRSKEFSYEDARPTPLEEGSRIGKRGEGIGGKDCGYVVPADCRQSIQASSSEPKLHQPKESVAHEIVSCSKVIEENQTPLSQLRRDETRVLQR
ncbi:MAG TPA: hypothetical protein VN397_04005 [Candidatus Methylomirabilis sp.]|nr:hypothetical protein [Candidatus Methylomirabilis sp.]